MANQNRFIDRFLPKRNKQKSYLRDVVSGSLYKVSDMKADSSLNDIKTQIETMRALAADSQISTALSYYATDATVTNTNGDVLWAVPIDKSDSSIEATEVVNSLLKRWNINVCARDHILELATIGNLYLPTTELYRVAGNGSNNAGMVALDNNTIPEPDYDVIPTYKIPPEDILHLYKQGIPRGFILQPEDSDKTYVIYPESAIIHFSLGGLLGEYQIHAATSDGVPETFDIKFAQPLLERAVQPTQTLNLLEDAVILSSLSRTVRFIAVECGSADENEQRAALQQLKDTIEQQLSINTISGDAQSFVNPQSPNNMIFVPKINGEAPISIESLDLAESNDADSKLLDYYQNKKLSVLGVPKEALNYSGAEGLGEAGNVLSQRSMLYANALQRLETAYKEGWRDAINKYFRVRNMSGFVDKYILEMQPIVTALSTVMSEKRNSAVTQAQSLIQLLMDLGVTDAEPYLKAVQESLKEEFPEFGGNVMSYTINVGEEGEGTEGFEGGPNEDRFNL